MEINRTWSYPPNGQIMGHNIQVYGKVADVNNMLREDLFHRTGSAWIVERPLTYNIDNFHRIWSNKEGSEQERINSTKTIQKSCVVASCLSGHTLLIQMIIIH